MKKISLLILISTLLIILTSCNNIVRGFGNQTGRNLANSVYHGGFFMQILLSGIVLLIVIGIIGLFSNKEKEKKLQKEEKIKRLEELKESDKINEEDYKKIKETLLNDTDSGFEVKLYNAKKKQILLKKYGEELGRKLFNNEYFVGMSKEQLIDCKGDPTKTEKDVLKTKIKETLIYGNKNSGDTFVLENDIVIRFKDK